MVNMPGLIKRVKDATPTVFLGGSCNPTTWRRDIAIPFLEAANITYYNPQVENWTPDLMAIEAEVKASCPILLFVIDAKTRALASLVEATELIVSGRTAFVVIERLQEGAVINGRELDPSDVRDLNRSRDYLADVCLRKQLRVYSEVREALDAIAQFVHSQPPVSKLKRRLKAFSSLRILPPSPRNFFEHPATVKQSKQSQPVVAGGHLFGSPNKHYLSKRLASI